jgi:hypothetical protein
VTLTVPAACAGVVAVRDVVLTTFTFVAAFSPKATVAPDWSGNGRRTNRVNCLCP